MPTGETPMMMPDLDLPAQEGTGGDEMLPEENTPPDEEADAPPLDCSAPPPEPPTEMVPTLELQLEEGLGFTGFGEDYGQTVDRADYMASLNGLFHIWLHEFGHGFGFPDYYDWDAWGGGLEAPNSVMLAGRAIQVTEWDQWMLR